IGSLEYHAHETVTAVAVLHQFVPNQGTFWDCTQDYLNRYLKSCIDDPDRISEPDVHAVYLMQMTTLGQRTAELHQALARTTGDPAFDPVLPSADEMAAQLDQLRL